MEKINSKKHGEVFTIKRVGQTSAHIIVPKQYVGRKVNILLVDEQQQPTTTTTEGANNDPTTTTEPQQQ